MSKLTQFERASLLMTAFKILDGWGTRDEKDRFVLHDLEKRKAAAIDLADWAIEESKDDTNTE